MSAFNPCERHNLCAFTPVFLPPCTHNVSVMGAGQSIFVVLLPNPNKRNTFTPGLMQYEWLYPRALTISQHLVPVRKISSFTSGHT